MVFKNERGHSGKVSVIWLHTALQHGNLGQKRNETYGHEQKVCGNNMVLEATVCNCGRDICTNGVYLVDWTHSSPPTLYSCLLRNAVAHRKYITAHRECVIAHRKCWSPDLPLGKHGVYICPLGIMESMGNHCFLGKGLLHYYLWASVDSFNPYGQLWTQ